MEFFSGQEPLGGAGTAPYSLTVNDLAAGTYSFTAKATDNLGLSTTSDAVSVSVVTPGPVSFDSDLKIVNGNFPLRLTLTPGLRYAIESAGDLSGWATLTNFVATSSLMEFLFPANAIWRAVFPREIIAESVASSTGQPPIRISWG